MIPLAEHVSEYGVVTILECRQTRARIYKQGDVFQSEADASGVSAASYIHAIFGLIRQTTARKVLMIGCGGGTLGTMLARTGYRVVAVDVNPVAFFFARRYFGLPAGVECHVTDGSQYLKLTAERYDAIVLDAYVGDTIPSHLRSGHFLSLVQRATRDGGCVFANVHTMHDADRDADSFAIDLEPFWPRPRLLDTVGQTNRNTIVAAGNVADLVRPALELVPAHDSDVVEAELAAMAFRAPAFSAGAPKRVLSPASQSDAPAKPPRLPRQ